MPDPVAADLPRTALFLDLCGSTAAQEPDPKHAPDSVGRGEAYGKSNKRLLERARAVIARYGGRAQAGPADDFCSGFDDPQAALVCALALQSELIAKPVFHARRPMACRIGVHAEPIAADPDGYLSQAGNLSSRIAAAGSPGGVVATGAVRELARGLTGVRFASLGEKSFKGTSRWVEVFTVACSAGNLKALAASVRRRVGRVQRALGTPHPGAAVGVADGRSYRLIVPLGRGGMGELWEATRGVRESTERFVVKFLRPDLLKNPVWREDLLRWFGDEAACLRALEIPGVPTGVVTLEAEGVWNPAGTGRGLPFLVMPKIEGMRFDEALARRLPAEQVACLARVAEVVSRIHARRLLHLDLKPANILVVERDGELHPTVIDLGLAQPFRPSSPPPADRFGQGTLAYMAPEQVSSRRGEVGPSTDVYSLAVLLFETLTTRHPCDLRAKRSESTRRQAILAGPTLTLKGLCPELPKVTGLDRILAKALNSDPGKRFSKAGMFQASLKAWLGTTSRRTVSAEKGSSRKGWNVRVAGDNYGVIGTVKGNVSIGLPHSDHAKEKGFSF